MIENDDFGQVLISLNLPDKHQQKQTKKQKRKKIHIYNKINKIFIDTCLLDKCSLRMSLDMNS